MKSLISELHTNRVLVVVLVVFIAVSAAYSLTTRLKYGPDEPAHFIYIRSLSTHLSIPAVSHEVTNTEDFTASHEAHQPPLYYAVMAVPYAALGAIGLSADSIWRVLRLLNIPLGVIWLLGGYVLAFEFFHDRARATAATAFAALIPTAAYTPGVINNENLISPLFTWSLVPMLAYFRSGTISRRSGLSLGLLIGLSILTKAQGIVLVAVLFIASIAILRRDDYRNWRQIGRSLMLVLSVATAISGWWFVRSWIAHGQLMPQTLCNPVYATGLASALIQPDRLALVVFAATSLTYGHFWIPYWLVQPFVPYVTFFYPLCILTGIALIGLVVRLARNGSLDRRALAFLLSTPLLVYLSWLRHALFVDQGANMQGRLFLCVGGVVAIVWVLAIEGLSRRRVVRALLQGATYLLLAAANAFVFYGIFVYPQH